MDEIESWLYSVAVFVISEVQPSGSTAEEIVCLLICLLIYIYEFFQQYIKQNLIDSNLGM
jgi:hypothetical protein